MRIAETDFILIPEWLAEPDGTSARSAQADDDHWISRWQRSIASARWLERGPLPAAERLAEQSAALSRPTVVVTHGHGIDVLLNATENLAKGAITGAFVVAPALETSRLAAIAERAQSLPCPSVIIAPDDHPTMPADTVQSLADHLGGHFVAAGTVGRLNAQSGHGPWPEGLMRLGWFLKRLSAH